MLDHDREQNASPIRWRSEDGALVLEASASVLESIRADASLSMNGAGQGGLEIGGLLFGRREERKLIIEDWRPIRCDHSRGPSFLLSSRDMAALSQHIETTSLEWRGGGLELLGWFVSHKGGEDEVRPEELKLHGRLFPAGAGLLLVLKPNALGDVEVCAHLVESGAGSFPVATRLPGVLQLSPMPGLSQPTLGRLPRPPEYPPAAGGAGQPLSGPGRIRALWLPLLASLLVLALTGLLGFDAYQRAFRAEPPPAEEPVPAADPVELLSLHVESRDGRMEITWNADAAPVREAREATLTVFDGGRSFRRPLSLEELQLGRIDYTNPASELHVMLFIERKDGPPVLERTAFTLIPPPSAGTP